MEPGIAAALVGAGMLSLLIFPQVATALRVGSQDAPEAGTAPDVQPSEPVSRAE